MNHPIPGAGRETAEYTSPPGRVTQQMQAPDRLPADVVLLPSLPASAEELADMASASLREPARCWTLSGSRDHVAALCGLLEMLEHALRKADCRCVEVSGELSTAETVAVAAEHARRHELTMRLGAEVDAANARDAHQADLLLLEASELRVQDDGEEILRLKALNAALSLENAELRHRLVAAGLQLVARQFDFSDVTEVVDVDSLDEPAVCRVSTVRIPLEPMAAIVEAGR